MTSESKRSIPPTVREVYGPADLSTVPAFAGGFINFGHWEGIDLTRPLTVADRVRSQQQLYRRVLEALTRTEESAGPARARGSVLEVGCGRGLGCALAVEEFAFDEVTGMDIHPQQVRRATEENRGLLDGSPRRLRFREGAAEHMPFEDGRFDGVYSVEAAQHFRDLAAFARETGRVLRPGGRLALAGFFPPDDRPDAEERLAGILDSFASGLDVAHPLDALTDALRAAGLRAVRVESIGAQVWPGWDRWLDTAGYAGTWSRNFLTAYREGLLDYYRITAEAPAAPPGDA
ncbi:class I SAM-dependent methyltransferase [Streptomyces sp. SAJ15]|uniref:class I SAM-dependent methyltransferase n=1 Tax=Streptomyces sp. SAJ15 TaxID=2011095 RepID=UPI0011866B5C|nr:class I SAM-dependent methyltransferase [Streptomyces sp. SAJ15]TVL89519.1 SAM-dependent methyltransferase [Streptomyces sp. SAJ15]